MKRIFKYDGDAIAGIIAAVSAIIMHFLHIIEADIEMTKKMPSGNMKGRSNMCPDLLAQGRLFIHLIFPTAGGKAHRRTKIVSSI